jgi:membrane protease YdiL (CAAX protease family)
MELLQKTHIKNLPVLILSIIFLLAGIIHYIYWGTRYGIWYDIGIYSLTIVLVLPGVIGIILSFLDKKEEEN